MDVMRKDKLWRQAVVVEQHPSGIGTELLFDNGDVHAYAQSLTSDTSNSG